MGSDKFFPQRPDSRPTIYAYEDTNPQYQGLLKIGCTSTEVQKRVAQQYPTLRPGKSNGPVWQYYDIPENVYNEMMNGSIGKYFCANIKGQYRESQVGKKKFTQKRDDMKKEIVEKVKKLKQKYEQEGFIFLGIFGSYARGEETPESDLDIIYKIDDRFLKKNIGWSSYSRIEDIQHDCEKEIGLSVDLVDENALDKIGKYFILPEVIHV